MKKPVISVLAWAVFASVGGVAHADDDGMLTYAVTVTNITRGQIIAPPAVIAHNADYKIFMLGKSASYELSQLAEAGNSGAVTNAASGMASVYSTALGSGGILPGASQTIEIQTTTRLADISVAAMLATTNDGFMAVSGARAPMRGGLVVEAIGYDAGSEANSDDCSYIPGPPCGDTRHNTATPEGYVHVHAGFHVGGSGLNPMQHDWRNPVAQVEIKRIN
ncbi:MAG: spondin domain-containing protein [Gammaproteobacteria bacterium]|nr:spondin domain-containing protein [Gammaproteobacteria bacterium]